MAEKLAELNIDSKDWSQAYSSNGFNLYRNGKEKLALAILNDVSSNSIGSAGNITNALTSFGCKASPQAFNMCTILGENTPYVLCANGTYLSLYSVGLFTFPQKDHIYGSILFHISN